VFTHRADDLTGLLVFAVLTLRTLLILVSARLIVVCWRADTCAVTFAICVACTIAAQYIGVYPFRLVALLPVIGIGLACLGEASDNAVIRRQSILALGASWRCSHSKPRPGDCCSRTCFRTPVPAHTI
jgi:hypothetical protein